MNASTTHDVVTDVPESLVVLTSDVELLLGWADASDLDLYVTGAATGSAASSGQPERLLLENVKGQLNIEVDPYLITGVPSTTYTLTATLVTVSGDSDDLVDMNATPSSTVISPMCSAVSTTIRAARKSR